MGCCFSSQDSRSPYPRSSRNDGAYSSARAITSASQPGLAAARPSTHHTIRSASSNSGNATPTQPPQSPVPNHPAARLRAQLISRLSEHYNAPLRRHIWRIEPGARVWTRSTLDREREEFFETRVTGQQEIWQTLRVALELLWAESLAPSVEPVLETDDTTEDGEDELDEEDNEYEAARKPSESLATAQSILDAADITIPTGDLANGAYDERGNLYQLPEHIVSDPLNLAPSPSPSTIGDDEQEEEEEYKSASGDELDTDAVMRRREEKGKTVIRRSAGEMIKLVARLSDSGGRDMVVEIGRNDSVRLLARLLHEEAGLPSTKRVRIAYLGRMLKESESPTAQGWDPNHILNAFVFERS